MITLTYSADADAIGGTRGCIGGPNLTAFDTICDVLWANRDGLTLFVRLSNWTASGVTESNALPTTGYFSFVLEASTATSTTYSCDWIGAASGRFGHLSVSFDDLGPSGIRIKFNFHFLNGEDILGIHAGNYPDNERKPLRDAVSNPALLTLTTGDCVYKQTRRLRWSVWAQKDADKAKINLSLPQFLRFWDSDKGADARPLRHEGVILERNGLQASYLSTFAQTLVRVRVKTAAGVPDYTACDFAASTQCVYIFLMRTDTTDNSVFYLQNNQLVYAQAYGAGWVLSSRYEVPSGAPLLSPTTAVALGGDVYEATAIIDNTLPAGSKWRVYHVWAIGAPCDSNYVYHSFVSSEFTVSDCPDLIPPKIPRAGIDVVNARYGNWAEVTPTERFRPFLYVMPTDYDADPVRQLDFWDALKTVRLRLYWDDGVTRHVMYDQQITRNGLGQWVTQNGLNAPFQTYFAPFSGGFLFNADFRARWEGQIPNLYTWGYNNSVSPALVTQDWTGKDVEILWELAALNLHSNGSQITDIFNYRQRIRVKPFDGSVITFTQTDPFGAPVGPDATFLCDTAYLNTCWNDGGNLKFNDTIALDDSMQPSTGAFITKQVLHEGRLASHLFGKKPTAQNIVAEETNQTAGLATLPFLPDSDADFSVADNQFSTSNEACTMLQAPYIVPVTRQYVIRHGRMGLHVDESQYEYFAVPHRLPAFPNTEVSPGVWIDDGDKNPLHPYLIGDNDFTCEAWVYMPPGARQGNHRIFTKKRQGFDTATNLNYDLTSCAGCNAQVIDGVMQDHRNDPSFSFIVRKIGTTGIALNGVIRHSIHQNPPTANSNIMSAITATVQFANLNTAGQWLHLVWFRPKGTFKAADQIFWINGLQFVAPNVAADTSQANLDTLDHPNQANMTTNYDSSGAPIIDPATNAAPYVGTPLENTPFITTYDWTFGVSNNCGKPNLNYFGSLNRFDANLVFAGFRVYRGFNGAPRIMTPPEVDANFFEGMKSTPANPEGLIMDLRFDHRSGATICDYSPVKNDGFLFPFGTYQVPTTDNDCTTTAAQNYGYTPARYAEGGGAWVMVK